MFTTTNSQSVAKEKTLPAANKMFKITQAFNEDQSSQQSIIFPLNMFVFLGR